MNPHIQQVCKELYTLIEQEESLHVYRDLFTQENIGQIALKNIANEPTLCGTLEAEGKHWDFEMPIGDFKPMTRNHSVTAKIAKIRDKALKALTGEICVASKLTSKRTTSKRDSIELSASSRRLSPPSSHPRALGYPATSTYPPLPPFPVSPPTSSRTDIRKREDHLDRQLSGERQRSYELERHITNLQAKLAGQDVDNTALKKKVLELEAALQTIHQTKEQLETKTLELLSLSKTFQQRNEALLESIAQEKQSAAAAMDKSVFAEDALRQFQETFTSTLSVTQERYDAELTHLQSTIDALTHALSSLAKKYASNLDQAHTKITQLEANLDMASADVLSTHAELMPLREALAQSKELFRAEERKNAELTDTIATLRRELQTLPAQHAVQLASMRAELESKYALSLAEAQKAFDTKLAAWQQEEEGRIRAQVNKDTIQLKRDHESQLRSDRAEYDHKVREIRQNYESQMAVLKAMIDGDVASATPTRVAPPASTKPSKPTLSTAIIHTSSESILPEERPIDPSVAELARLRNYAAVSSLEMARTLHQHQERHEALLAKYETMAKANKMMAERLLHSIALIGRQHEELQKRDSSSQSLRPLIELPEWIRELPTYVETVRSQGLSAAKTAHSVASRAMGLFTSQ